MKYDFTTIMDRHGMDAIAAVSYTHLDVYKRQKQRGLLSGWVLAEIGERLRREGIEWIEK